MSTLETLKKNRAAILAIVAKHGAGNVCIFSSVVRGEDTDESDIDVLVDMAADRSLYDLIGFQREIEVLVGRKADVLTESGLNRYLKDRILAEAAPAQRQFFEFAGPLYSVRIASAACTVGVGA